jgi:O-antigen ligase
MNFSVVSQKVRFYETVLVVLLLISLFYCFKEFDLSNIIKPAILWASSIIFIYGLFQKYYIFPDIISNYSCNGSEFSNSLIGKVKTGRIFSIFSLPTLYGIICAILVLYIFHYLRDNFNNNDSMLGKIYLFVLLFTGGYNLILTQSFGAIIALTIGLFVYLIIEQIINIKYISLIIMAMSLIIFIVIGLRYKEVKNLEPVKLRLTNWNQAIRMISDNPFFGVGLGNYATKVSYYTKQGEARSIYTHNFFLQFVAEAGIPLSILLLLLIFINRKKIILIDYKKKKLYIAIFAMLLFYNMIDIGLYFIITGVFFSFILSQIYPKQTENKKLTISILLICSVLYSLIYLSNDNFTEANIFLNMNKVNKAKTLYEKSIKLNPFNSGAILGKALTVAKDNNSQKKLTLINKALSINPEYGFALYNKSLIEYKMGHLLSAFYYAGAAYKKNMLNNNYRKWYEFIKTNLPSRNTIKRD